MTEIINGVDTKFDGPWEIVCAGPAAWIGRVTEAITDEVTLSPCYAYIFQISAGPQGPQMMRDVWPLELFVSNVPVRIKWTNRRRLADFDEADRETLWKLVQGAVDAQKRLRGARANIVLGAQMPPGRPGARG